MSRSYKKYPAGKAEKSCKIGQRFANKKVRKYSHVIPNGNSYKKIYESWDICDYKYVFFSSNIPDHIIKFKRK